MTRKWAAFIASMVVAGLPIAGATGAGGTTNLGCPPNGCVAELGQAAGIRTLPGGELYIHGTYAGVKVAWDGTLAVLSDNFAVTYSATVNPLGVVSGQGQFSVYRDGGTDLNVPVTVSGTQARTVFDSSYGGMTHFVWSSTGSSVFGPGVGTGVFSTELATVPSGNAITSAGGPASAHTTSSVRLVADECDTAAPVAPTGSMVFTDTTTSPPVLLGAADLSASTAQACSTASIATMALATGTHTITAHYVPGGVTPFAPNPDASFAVTMYDDATSTAVSASPNPAATGSPVTISVTVCNTTDASPSPTGMVNLADSAASSMPSVRLSPGAAPCSTASGIVATLAAGSHTITATYAPDAGFAGSSASYSQQVGSDNTAVTITSDYNPANTGVNVTFTATVCDTSADRQPPGQTEIFDEQGDFDQTITLAPTTSNCAAASLTAQFAATGQYLVHGRYFSSDTAFAGSPNTPDATMTETVDYPLT